MTDEKVTLEIRHQIGIRDDGTFFVRERFGEQPPIEWDVPDRASGERLAAERADMLMKMVARVSPEAAEAVAEARIIDNLKAGHA